MVEKSARLITDSIISEGLIAEKSGTHDVKQGTGAHYFTAYSGANQTKVCLAAENNNDLPNSYTVSGYWDEETY